MTDNRKLFLDPNDEVHLLRLRKLVAGIFRKLLSAWQLTDPGTIYSCVEEDWWREREAESGDPADLVESAANRRRDLSETEFLDLDSISIISDPAKKLTVEQAYMEIRELTAEFPTEADLRQVVKKLRINKQIDWPKLISKECLVSTRRALNSLPIRKGASNATLWDLQCEQGLILFQGTSYAPGRISYRLIEHLLRCEGNSCLARELAVPVWQNRKKDTSITSELMKSAVKNTTKFLVDNHLPFRVVRDSPYVRLQRSEGNSS